MKLSNYTTISPENFTSDPAIEAGFRKLVTSKGHEVWTDAESCGAIEADLIDAVDQGRVKGGFGSSLAEQAKRRDLSIAQVAWAAKLMADLGNPRRTTPASTVNVERIRDMFDGAWAVISTDAAANGRRPKNPKVTINNGTVVVTFKRCGDKSKAPGAINVHEGDGKGGFGNDGWVGRIGRDGDFLLVGHKATQPSSVKALVRAFADDPEGIAAAHGHLVNACCFCSRTLTDGRSIAVGFGPVCADKFGLEWGSATVNDEQVEIERRPEEATDQHAYDTGNACWCPTDEMPF